MKFNFFDVILPVAKEGICAGCIEILWHVILMFFQDHHPPHFHAKYEGQLAVYSIKGCRLIAGKLPPRATRLIREWAKIHEKELMDDWNIAQKEGKLKTIEPLS